MHPEKHLRIMSDVTRIARTLELCTCDLNAGENNTGSSGIPSAKQPLVAAPTPAQPSSSRKRLTCACERTMSQRSPIALANERAQKDRRSTCGADTTTMASSLGILEALATETAGHSEHNDGPAAADATRSSACGCGSLQQDEPPSPTTAETPGRASGDAGTSASRTGERLRASAPLTAPRRVARATPPNAVETDSSADRCCLSCSLR